MLSTTLRTRTRQLSPPRIAATLGALVIVWGTKAQDVPNPHTQAIMQFQNRMAAYMTLHNQAEAELPRLKTTNSPADISTHQHLLAEKIRKRREPAGQGTIFSPEISQELRRLAGIPLQGVNSNRVHKSLKSAEPVPVRLKANTAYPASLPLQSIPPTLLENLPKLPAEVEYRIAGHDLILRDIAANLVIDYLPNAIP